MKFFFDNNLAAKIAKGLNGFVAPEHQVIHLRDKFDADTDDTVWMAKLGEDGIGSSSPPMTSMFHTGRQRQGFAEVHRCAKNGMIYG